MANVDRELQPVADRINRLGTASAMIASNNQGLQAEYDRRFDDCMAARGNVPERSLVSSAAFPAPAPSASSAVPDTEQGVLPDGWRLLRLSYHGGMGDARDVSDLLWRKEIANPPAGPGKSLAMYSMSFREGESTMVLSIAGQAEPACDNGPNDVLSTRDYAVCPAKLALVHAGRPTAIRSMSRACAEVINDGGVRPGEPGWKDPGRWGTRGRFNPTSGTIELITLQNGRPEPTCTAKVRVP